jgi:hypothetical protein
VDVAADFQTFHFAGNVLSAAAPVSSAASVRDDVSVAPNRRETGAQGNSGHATLLKFRQQDVRSCLKARLPPFDRFSRSDGDGCDNGGEKSPALHIADRAARRRADGSADNGAGSRPQQPIVQTLAGHGRRSSDSDSEKKRQCE